MKKILLSLLAMTSILYLMESNNTLGFGSYKPSLSVTEKNGQFTMVWPKLPWPAYYEVDVLTTPAANPDSSPVASQKITSFRTWKNNFTLDLNEPVNIAWRVSAQGFFRHPLGRYSDPLSIADITGLSPENPLASRPAPTSLFTPDNPASLKPMLTWTSVPGAVYYEFELYCAAPENQAEADWSNYRIFRSQEVYTAGYNPDLTSFPYTHYYWRVRARDYDGNPLGEFSAATELFVDRNLTPDQKPLIINNFDGINLPVPLYPVYAWIPINGATRYEVEVTDNPPENPNGIEPSAHRIWAKETSATDCLDCYDDVPRIVPGQYYWRVRGLDDNGGPVGVYSDAGEYCVDLAKGYYAATFGDSITHGGGAISYSPADWEYSFQSYLDFPIVNLGKSGDTSSTMVERFDQDVIPYHPRYLIIMGGTNSLRGGIPASQVIRDLAAIKEKCRANNIRPIFLTLPPINPEAITRAFNEDTVTNWRSEFDRVNDFIRQQPYYIELEPYFSDENRELPALYAIDGLHLDIEGKKLIAQIIKANWPRVTR